jgi:Mor family transcriptional regulator
MADSENQYGELLADLMEVLTTKLLEATPGLTPEKASRIALDTVDHIRFHWGGSMIYIPTKVPLDMQRRDEAIFAEFNGRNWREICKKWGISRGHIYQICRRFRGLRQGCLDLDLGDDEVPGGGE